MNSPHDGGSAFPVPLLDGESWDWGAYGNPNGMSLRDWFAGMALQGAAMYVNEHADVNGRGNLVKSCYAIADAMLAARERKETL